MLVMIHEITRAANRVSETQSVDLFDAKQVKSIVDMVLTGIMRCRASTLRKRRRTHRSRLVRTQRPWRLGRCSRRRLCAIP